MHSQTGAVEVVKEFEDFTVTVELKSVNSKGLQVSFSLPFFLEKLEPVLYREFSEILKRGSIRLRVRVEFLKKELPFDHFEDEDLKLLEEFSQKVQQLGYSKPDFIESVRFLRLLSKEDVEEEVVEKCHEVIIESAELLMREREKEGEKLKKWFVDRVEELENYAQLLLAKKDFAFQNNLKKVKEYLESALGKGSVDEKHLVSLLYKSVYTEEIERLKIHLERIKKLVLSPEIKKGYKLDFLLQECLRELNTLAAKAQDAEISSIVADAKVVVMDMREQAANVV